jgi:hypothetical protein
MAEFSTVRSRKKPRKLVTDDVKQSTHRHQNLKESRDHNEAKERTEEGRIQQVESEAQNRGNGRYKQWKGRPGRRFPEQQKWTIQ